MAPTPASRVGREEVEEAGLQRGLQDPRLMLVVTVKLREYERRIRLGRRVSPRAAPPDWGSTGSFPPVPVAEVGVHLLLA